MQSDDASNPMETGIKMPASQRRWGYGLLGVGLATALLGGVGVALSYSTTTRSVTALRNSAAADASIELVAGSGCSLADQTILGTVSVGFTTTFKGCASYSVFWGWDADGTARCLANEIHITPTCASCFADAVGYAYDNCRSGACSSDQCGQECADCLAPAKHTSTSCVGGDYSDKLYALAVRSGCRPGIDGMVSADDCERQTGETCTTSADCSSWSNAECVEGRCECSPPHTCSVNDGECVVPGTCPKFTGGTCAVLGCNAVRNSECVGSWGSGLCMCSSDQCVHDGHCV